METKYIISGGLIGAGAFMLVYGFLNANQSYINLGIAGIFLGGVIITFKSSRYVKKEAIENVLNPYRKFFEKLAENLSLEGNAVYIPPYDNLPEGGIFIPLNEDFDIDLARLDEKTIFLTDVPKENQMGLLIRPLGLELLKTYEEHLEYSLEGVNYKEVEAASGAVLKSLGLAKTVYIDEEGEIFKIVVQPEDLDCGNLELCKRIACPICSSILLGLAKATGELIHVENIEKKDYGIELKAKKLGGVRNWM